MGRRIRPSLVRHGDPPSISDDAGRWSVFVGASQSKLVDLLVRNTLNVGLVIGLVCLLVATAPGTPALVLGIVGGSLSLLALLLTFWLLRREARRGTSLLNTFVGAKLLLLVAAGAGYHAAPAG